MASKKKSNQKTKGGAKAKKNNGLIVAIAVIVVIIIVAAILIYILKPDLFRKAYDAYTDYVSGFYGDSSDDDPAGTDSKPSLPVEEGKLSDIAGSDFSIHFLELGNKYTGDCTLIKCGNTEVLIDAGSRKNSATAIKSYVDQYCTDGVLEYVVATHAHQDHIAGFVGSSSGDTQTGILYQYKIGTIIQFAGHNTTSGIYNSYVTAVAHAEENGAVAYTALDCWNQTGKKATQAADDPREAKRQYDLSVAGDNSLTLNVLYNYYYEHETEDENDYSVCVLLSHTSAEGEKSHYLFTGDLEGKGEEYLVDGNDLPEVELFKGGHHGSKTSSTDKLLKVIKPKNVAVCCCCGSTEYTKNNDNTFPTQAFVDRISAYTQNVYCTTLCTDYDNGKVESLNGNIVFYFSDKKLNLWCSNGNVKLKDTEWFKNNRTCPAAWA